MAYKSFLAFSGIENPNTALDQPIELAKLSGAHLDIVLLGILRSPPVAIHDVVPAAEWIQHNQEVMDIALNRVRDVEKYAAERGISASVAAECDYPGNLEKLAARYGLCADALVVTGNSLKADESVRRAFNGTLFDAGCPVLLIPEKHKGLDDMSRIVVAWNGKAEASHAVRSALPLLKEAARVNIVSIDPVEGDVGQDPGSDLAAYLARYGIEITVDVLASGGMSISEKLMQRATDIDADLLVMGGYGHTKFREWLLGGATYEMLANAKLPVFMMH